MRQLPRQARTRPVCTLTNEFCVRLQLREELDNAAKLNRARRDLAFGAAQADINQKYDELEAELRKSREELEVRPHAALWTRC